MTFESRCVKAATAILLCASSALGAELRVPVTGIAFSPDSARLLMGGNREVLVYDVLEGKQVLRIPCDFQKITSITFTPDRNTFAVSGGTPAALGGARFFRWPEGTADGLLTNHTDQATCITFNAAGTSFALTGADGVAAVFRWPDRSRIYRLEGHAGAVLAAAFSPDDQLLITASADRSIKVWKMDSGQLLRSFSHHTDIVHGLAFRPKITVEGEPVPYYCATASQDRTVRVWQPEIGRMVRIVRGHEAPVFTVVYSRGGDQLFSAGKDGIVRTIDADSDEIIGSWQAHDDWIYSMTLSPNGLTLATGDWKGVVKLWRLEAGVGKLLHAIR